MCKEEPTLRLSSVRWQRSLQFRKAISSGQEENSSPGYAKRELGGKADHEIPRNPYRSKRLQESIKVLSGHVWIRVNSG